MRHSEQEARCQRLEQATGEKAKVVVVPLLCIEPPPPGVWAIRDAGRPGDPTLTRGGRSASQHPFSNQLPTTPGSPLTVRLAWLGCGVIFWGRDQGWPMAGNKPKGAGFGSICY